MASRSELDVRPFEHAAEYAAVVDYFTAGGDAFLRGMGVDPERLPSREAWLSRALADQALPDEEKQRLYLAWRVHDGGQWRLAGHSSASHIRAGDSCHIHLHLWRPELRRAGLGTELFRRSIDLYFERLAVERVICEPAAHNPGPNRTARRLGFRHVKTYRCVPTEIALEQEVSRWEMTRAAWSGGQHLP